MSSEKELLGTKVKNKLTDVEGICEQKMIWLFGCTQYAGKVTNSNSDKTEYFLDEAPFLEVLETKLIVDTPIPMGRQQELFGKLCRDKVSGFEGVCIGRKIGIYSADQYFLESKANKKGKIKKYFFDEGRVEVVSEVSIEQEVTSERPGGVSTSYRNDALLEQIMNCSH